MTLKLKQDRKRERGSGFTLIELLIIIIILGIVASVVAFNVAGFLGESPSYRGQAIYTIYVEEAGERREIGTLDIGVVEIWAPGKMAIGESKGVSVYLIPSEELRVRPPSIDIPETYYKITDTVFMYPVMSAQLEGANFIVSNQQYSYKVIPADRMTEWVWSISAKDTGHQLLIIELNAPVRVEGFEMLATEAVYQQSFEVMVTQPFKWTPFWIGLASVGTLLGGIAAIAAIVHLFRRRSRAVNNS
jgi:hypothetical protein